MSTSILYHGLGIYCYRYTSTQYRDGAIIFTIEKDPYSLRCPYCKSVQVIRRGFQTRWFHALAIGRKQICVRLHIPHVFCRLCSFVRQITIGFADVRFTYTKSFERYVVELSRHMTIQDVAHLRRIQSTDQITCRRMAIQSLGHECSGHSLAIKRIAPRPAIVRHDPWNRVFYLEHLQNSHQVFFLCGKWSLEALIEMGKQTFLDGAHQP